MLTLTVVVFARAVALALVAAGRAVPILVRIALGLADCIVDLVETGRTLDENGLEAVEDVAACSARLLVNRASFHARRADVAGLIDRLREARA